MRLAVALSALLHVFLLMSVQFAPGADIGGWAGWAWGLLLALLLALLAWILWLIFGAVAIAAASPAALAVALIGGVAALVALTNPDDAKPIEQAAQAPPEVQTVEVAHPQPEKPMPQFAMVFEAAPLAPAQSEDVTPQSAASRTETRAEAAAPQAGQAPRAMPAMPVKPTLISLAGDAEREHAARAAEERKIAAPQPVLSKPARSVAAAETAGVEAGVEDGAADDDATRPEPENIQQNVPAGFETLLAQKPRLAAIHAALRGAPDGHGTADGAASEVQERLAAAAARGYVHAQFAYAESLLTKTRGAERVPQAAALLERAALAGHVPAQLTLALLAIDGADNRKPDPAAAAAWLAVAARRGETDAAAAQKMLLAEAAPQQAVEAIRAERALLRRIAQIDKSGGVDPQRNVEESLWAAATLGDVEKVQQLLTRSADIDSADEEGRTPLIEVAWRGYGRLTNTLIQAGADIDARDHSGKTPLAWAAINGHSHVILMLIRAGASADVADRDGVTPLMRAAWNGHAATVRALIEAGARTSRVSNDGRTAADFARLGNHAAVLRLLNG